MTDTHVPIKPRREKRKLDMIATGMNIHNRCQEQGVSARILAEWLEISQQACFNWFSGRKMPSIDHLCDIGDCLDVPIDDLVVRKPVSLPQKGKLYEVNPNNL